MHLVTRSNLSLRAVALAVLVVSGWGVSAARDDSPRSGKGWYAKGMSLHEGRRYPQAIEAFQKAIQLGYREDASSFNVACGYALLGEKDRAFEWLRKASDAGFDLASALDDDDLDGLHADPRWDPLARSLRAGTAGAAAAARFDRLAARPKPDGSALFQVGMELLRASDFDRSARAFQMAAGAGYRPGTSLYNAACALSRKGDGKAALDELERAIEAGFDSPGLVDRDSDLRAIRRDPRFEELARRAEDLSLPGDEVARWLGLKASQKQIWKDAAERYRRVLKAHPESGRAHFNLGYTALRLGDPQGARDEFQRALELGYRKPTTTYNLACALARLGQKDAAFDTLFRAIDAGFDDADTLEDDRDLESLRSDPRFPKALRAAGGDARENG